MTNPAEFTAPPRRAGWIERPDARIRYEVTGEGPAIVFAHGLGGIQRVVRRPPQEVHHPRQRIAVTAQRVAAMFFDQGGGDEAPNFSAQTRVENGVGLMLTIRARSRVHG